MSTRSVLSGRSKRYTISCDMYLPPSNPYGSNLSEAKIREFDNSLVLVEVAVQEVLRLEVSVDDPIFVAILYRLCNLHDAGTRFVLCVVILRSTTSTRGKEGTQ